MTRFDDLYRSLREAEDAYQAHWEQLSVTVRRGSGPWRDTSGRPVDPKWLDAEWVATQHVLGAARDQAEAALLAYLRGEEA